MLICYCPVIVLICYYLFSLAYYESDYLYNPFKLFFRILYPCSVLFFFLILGFMEYFK